jgi:hypothetical protein
MSIEKYISPLIASQFPAFYKEQGPNFIAFVKAYYEWMEQEGEIINMSRSMLDNIDIDKTEQQFIDYFIRTFIQQIPYDIAVNKQLLIKHCVDLYRTKGTKRAIELLFRLVFDESIEFYIPGEHLFKSSDNTWEVPRYIEVSSSTHLQGLVGKPIYSVSATAVVDSYVQQAVNNKMINILFLSSINGRFQFGEQIFSDDLYVNSKQKYATAYEVSLLSDTEQADYSLAITYTNAPIIFGSLTAVNIVNGGTNFEIGDELDISGDGLLGKARVAAIRDENGKVSFTLLDGGFGFTTNAVVTVTGGGGSGASFEIGDISNKQIFQYNTDTIQDYLNTQLEDQAASPEMDITIDTSSGNMTVSETVNSSANSVILDVTPISGTLSAGDILEFTDSGTYGTISLLTYRSDSSLLYVTGTEANLTHANLVAGVYLSNSSSTVLINNIWPKQTVTGSGDVVSANSTHITITNANGYFIANSTITGQTSGKTANIVSVARLTDWGFPVPTITNLDETMENTLTVVDLEVGTIRYLTAINPGSGYSADPTVEIVEPLVYGQRLDDGNGGFYGYNAIVEAKAGTASGIVTALEVIDSGFGYLPGSGLTAQNQEINQTSVAGFAVTALDGKSTGRWLNNKSFPSDTNYLQDSYYYQQYSYEIISTKMKSMYEKMVNEIAHPSGLKMFGAFSFRSVPQADVSTAAQFVLTQT